MDEDAASTSTCCSATLGDSTPRDEGDSTPRNESVPFEDEDAASTCCSTPRDHVGHDHVYLFPTTAGDCDVRDDDLLILADCALDAGEEITSITA